MEFNDIIIILLILLGLCLLYPKSQCERFTMATCPNCFKRNRMQCFQCTNQCVWCQQQSGQGMCVPAKSKSKSKCQFTESRPDPMTDAHMYLPGQRRWWDWGMPQDVRNCVVNIPNTKLPLRR